MNITLQIFIPVAIEQQNLPAPGHSEHTVITCCSFSLTRVEFEVHQEVHLSIFTHL